MDLISFRMIFFQSPFKGRKMKNQYFGDINDFRKYLLLKALENSGIEPIHFVWMLTENEQDNPDGNKLKYLYEGKYKNTDPSLQSILLNSIMNGNRNVSTIENSSYFSTRMTYSNDMVPQKIKSRQEWFSKIKLATAESKLVFFDPDNGIECRSVTKSHTKSVKYIFWDEIKEIWDNDKSVLIYQHFPRVKRKAFISRISQEAMSIAPSSKVYIFKNPHTFFLLLLQPSMRKELIDLLEHLRLLDKSVFETYKIIRDDYGNLSMTPVYDSDVIEHEYIENILSMKKEDFSPLLELIPALERAKYFSRIRESSIGEHTLSFPLYEEEEIVESFRAIAYSLKLVIPFNWPDWKEGEDLYNTTEDYSSLDLIKLCKLMTGIIRHDRFCEGFLIGAFEKHKILNILYAIKYQFDNA